MVEAPTMEQVLVAYNDAVIFMDRKGLLMDFADTLPGPLNAANCIRVSEYLMLGDESVDERLRAGGQQTLSEVKDGSFDPFHVVEQVADDIENGTS